MDDIVSLFKARKTCIEMLTDRGYVVSDNLKCNNENEFKKMYNNKQCDMLINEPQKCYVRFVLINKVRPNMLRDNINQIRENQVDESEDIILVIRNKPNSTLLKITREFKNIQIFWLRNLIINITHHILVPKHRKLNEKEIDEVLKKYSLVNRCT